MAGSITGGHGWPVAGSGMPWLASITEGHGWPVAGSGMPWLASITEGHGWPVADLGCHGWQASLRAMAGP